MISRYRSVIPTLDNPSTIGKIVEQTKDISVAYKIGASVALRNGLKKSVEYVKQFSNPETVIIYDHQKAGGDVPFTARNYAEVMRESNVNAAILFPFGGIDTQEAWTKELQENGVVPIIGGSMTHKGFHTSQGGYIEESSILRIYEKAIEDDVKDIIVPGNNPEFIKKIISVIGLNGIVFYSTGIGKQGGSITENLDILGNVSYHVFIGRSIYESDNFIESVKKYNSELNK